jgi:hypothetical protein
MPKSSNTMVKKYVQEHKSIDKKIYATHRENLGAKNHRNHVIQLQNTPLKESRDQQMQNNLVSKTYFVSCKEVIKRKKYNIRDLIPKQIRKFENKTSDDIELEISSSGRVDSLARSKVLNSRNIKINNGSQIISRKKSCYII